MKGPITLDVKWTGKRSAGNPHAAFDVAGAGNVIMAAGLRAIAKAVGNPPEPKVRAPVLDPTDEGGQARACSLLYPLIGLKLMADMWDDADDQEMIEREWDSVCDEAGLTIVDRNYYWRRQFLNPFAFYGALGGVRIPSV